MTPGAPPVLPWEWEPSVCLWPLLQEVSVWQVLIIFWCWVALLSASRQLAGSC